MGTSYNPKIITNGLILNLDAGNKKSYSGSGTTWTDLTKNRNIGTLSNVTFDSGNGGSMSFNGTSSYISTNTPSPGSMPITFEFWVNSSSSTPLGIYDSAPNLPHVLRNFNDVLGGGYVEWWNKDPTVTLQVPASIWTQIVIGYRFETNRYIDYYQNGKLISTTSGSTTSTFNWTTLRFGDINLGVGGRYTGKIAIARIYNKSLSASEVLQNYNATKGRFGL